MRASAKILKLKIALGGYTNATDVQSFGYEELRDNGEAARVALGFPQHHAPDCAWPNGYSKPAEYDYENEQWGDPGEYISGERCTCGLQDQIDQTIAFWAEQLERLS